MTRFFSTRVVRNTFIAIALTLLPAALLCRGLYLRRDCAARPARLHPAHLPR